MHVWQENRDWRVSITRVMLLCNSDNKMFVLWLILHTLWNQLLLELSLDLFNTSQLCYRHTVDVHKKVWCWKIIFIIWRRCYSSQPGIICMMLRNTFWWHFLLMLGIHARNVPWDITNCARVDATSESANQGHSEVKGQIGAFWSWTLIFYHLCNKIQVKMIF